MQHKINSKILILVWFFLVTATFISTWLSKQNDIDVVLAINFMFLLVYLKGRSIVLSFMSMKDAPKGWRIAYELWLAIIIIIIAVMWNLGDF